MKKILILSLNALPLDVISSYRAKAYCDHFFSFDIYPTLLTVRYEYENDGSFAWHKNSDEIIREVYTSYSVIRLPRVKTKLSKSPLHTFVNFLKGNLDVELLPTYLLYRKFLFEHLKNNHYDLLLGIYSPHFHLKLAYEIKRKFGVPYILDFRDLWGGNRYAKREYNPTLKEKIEDKLIKFWWRRWMKAALFYSITSQHWLGVLDEVSGEQKGFVIRNGIEKFYHQEESESKRNFRIVYFGAIYPEQYLSLFFEGFLMFIKKHRAENVVVEFIGLKENYRNGVKSEIINNLRGFSKLVFTPAMTKRDLLNYCKNVNLFWYPAFSGIQGWFSAKLYDYMASGKEILVCPGDDGEVDNVILSSKSGVVVNSAEGVAEFLGIRFSEFVRKREKAFGFDPERLKGYTRVVQVERMASKINIFLTEEGQN
jgi:glycosyltransferase involved in cell wall biosynthesis